MSDINLKIMEMFGLKHYENVVSIDIKLRPGVPVQVIIEQVVTDVQGEAMITGDNIVVSTTIMDIGGSRNEH